MVYKRQLTSTEKIYIANNRISPPCATQLILEGTGVLDKEPWLAAISQAGDANPGSRLIMKGSLCFSHWEDSGQPPALREVDGSSWSGYSSEGAEFLEMPLSVKNGPSCEVVLIKGSQPRVLFRSHHAVMDGRGTLVWIEEVFRALRGEPLLGNPSRLTEYRLARSFQNQGRIPAPHHFPALTGESIGSEPGSCWQRVSLPGPIPNLLPKVAWILANEIWRENPRCPVRFAVPVDMRPHGNNIRSTGNLSNLIYLDISPASTPQTITKDLKTQLAENKDGMLYWGDRFIRFFPLYLIEHSVKKEIKQKQKIGLYRNSGLISNLGRLPIERFTGGGFRTTSMFGLPIKMESIPFFLGICGTVDRVELMLGMSKRLANGGRLERTMETLAARLSNL